MSNSILRDCLIDDVEIFYKDSKTVVVLTCRTEAGGRFTTAIHPNPHYTTGWRREQFLLVQKMLKSYEMEDDIGEGNGFSEKALYATLRKLFFRFRLKVGPKTKDGRTYTIEQFRRCEPFACATEDERNEAGAAAVEEIMRQRNEV